MKIIFCYHIVLWYLLYLKCLARAEFSISPDIVEGSPVGGDDVPYQASFEYAHRFCGGSIIGDRHVLTAAHCVSHMFEDKSLIKKLKVWIGSNALRSGTVYHARRVSHHKDYVHRPLANDIAMIQLSEKIKFTPKAQKIGIPSSESEGDLPAGTDVLLSGFGIDKLGGHRPQIMRKLKTKTISWEDCKKESSLKLSKGTICSASVLLNNKTNLYDGNCEGDSGGPMATIDKKMVVGVFSAFQWGHNTRRGCGSSKPNVFTRVSHYLDYINSELNYYTSHPFESGEHPIVTDRDASSD